MLSESFIASSLTSGKTPPSATLRDVGICVHEFQPSSVLRSTFKKSSTPTNCLAVSSSHVFAAQAEKAVIHVYSRERGNQEATVPFPERIRSIAIAGGDNGDILILGTEGGRLILWEVFTGRQVATTPSHLQPVTSLEVDPTSNFVLSGSSDASVHVWSLVNILSFTKQPSGRDQQQPNSPIRTISNHRAAITSLAVGHSTGRYNIAISTSRDNTAVVWDYHTGRVLRTFLLPSIALCMALDPVDRAFYVGYEDGSVQAVDFYKNHTTQHPLHDPSLQSTPSQISTEDRWLPPSADMGRVESLSVSYDGTILLSGHSSGKVLSWNVGRRKYASTVADYTHRITNMQPLPPNGLPHTSSDPKRISHTIVKPRHDHGLSAPSHNPGTVPAEYTFNTHILPSTSSRPATGESRPSQFSDALTHAFFPDSMIDDGLAELAAFRQPGSSDAAPQSAGEDPSTAQNSQIKTLTEELATLRKRLSATESARQSTTDETVKLRAELASQQDYIGELHEKRDRSYHDKIQWQSRKEEKETRRREAWFAAEKKGERGDRAVRAMEVEEGDGTSGTGESSE